ncbi:MAG: type IV conjugative transfer system protein TraE [Nitrospirae bacterium]|nr:MAG: type IV conjugative transfer system protein TraE [Nitrospirota bacterium]
MKLDLYLNRTSNVFAENRLLKFVVIVIGIVTLYNTVIIKQALNYQRTILVPPVITKQLEIQGDNASDEYIRQMTQYIIDLALIYTPANAKNRFEELLTFYTPESYPQAKETFLSLLEKIKIAQISNVFYIQKMELDRAGEEVTIMGLRRRFVHDAMNDKSATYILKYRIQDGRFMVVSIAEEKA